MFCEFFGIALFGFIAGGLVSAVKISLLTGKIEKSEKKQEFDYWLYEREKNTEKPIINTLLRNLRTINHFNFDNQLSDLFQESPNFNNLPKE